MHVATRRRSVVLAVVAAGVAQVLAADRQAEPTGSAKIVRTFEIVGTDLPAGGTSIAVGGISDLHYEPATPARPAALWAITDRGPNGVLRDPDAAAGGEKNGNVGSVKKRTLLAPDFVPSLVQLDAACLDALGPDADPGETRHTVAVRRVVPLAGRSGRPVSGRPNGIGRDEPAHAADGGDRLAHDPDGVDTEGVVIAGDGGFWVVEEHRPSILRVDADGKVLARHVPAGDSLPGADTSVVQNLPAHFATRADNRGFEAVAITPDARRLFVLMQSPLDRDAGVGEPPGTVPLLEFDTAACAPVAEHRYVLDRADKDGKLCAMACLGPRAILVLEQADGGMARLYRVETSADAGATAVRKVLIADLAPLLTAMLADVRGDGRKKGSVKIEGLAIVDDRHLLLANDNDFGVADAGAKARRPPRNCLWLIELSHPLQREPRT